MRGFPNKKELQYGPLSFFFFSSLRLTFDVLVIPPWHLLATFSDDSVLFLSVQVFKKKKKELYP
jgi:hypothetical protein